MCFENASDRSEKREDVDGRMRKRGSIMAKKDTNKAMLNGRRLYGDFCPEDWRAAFSVPKNMIPSSIIAHGEYEPTKNLAWWNEILGPDTINPEWNIVVGEYKQDTLAFTNVLGGPAAAMAIHPFAAMGTEKIIQTGYFGGLSKELEYGQILVVSEVIASCGTATQYCNSRKKLTADPSLVNAATEYCSRRGWRYRVGSVRSTDAIYLEDRELVREWLDSPELGVDMECSATFSIAQKFNKSVVGLLNLSDHLIRGDHLMNYREERLKTEASTDKKIRELALYLASEV